jgi:hypothetical protein
MKRPSFQFYPADWKNNSKLRRCSEAARGAWVDVLCLLHDSDEYGVCRWPLAELARAAGIPIKLAKELATKDVLKGADKDVAPYIHTPTHAGKKGEPVVLVESYSGPTWYCSRFVRDEWLRQRRGAGTRFGAEQPQPKRRTGDQDKPATTSDVLGAPTGAPQQPPIGSPTRPVGDRQGDGATSTSSLTSKAPPIPPKGGEPGEQKAKGAISLRSYLDDCRKAGAKAIPEGHAVFAYATKVGIPEDFLRLHWLEFKDRYTAPDSKRYKAWPTVFHKSVKGNWFKLWFLGNDGNYALTTVGQQAQRSHAEGA